MRLNRASVIAVVLACLPVRPGIVHAEGCPERPACHGCGCKGGPGHRNDVTGKCVGFKALEQQCGNPPTLRCTFENAPVTGWDWEVEKIERHVEAITGADLERLQRAV